MEAFMKRKIIFIAILLLFISSVATTFAQSTTEGRSGRRRRVQNYTLTVNSNVKGAQIYIDGNAQKGSIPYSVSLESGTHTVTLKASGYHDGSATVNLNSNQTIQINLNPLKATIVPTKHHPDFIVIVDGKQQGSGPIKVLPGTHTIEFRIGALSAKGTYTFEAGRTYRVQPSLSIDFNY